MRKGYVDGVSNDVRKNGRLFKSRRIEVGNLASVEAKRLASIVQEHPVRGLPEHP